MIIHFNSYTRFLLLFLAVSFSFSITGIHAKALVIDRIYLIVNSQMITRTEAQDVAAALNAQNSTAEKSQTQLNEKLLMNLVQEMLLLDRAEALKIIPGAKEIELRLDRLAVDQPQLLEVYAEEDLKEQLAREFKKHHVISREVDSKIRLEGPEIVLFCKQQLRKDRQVGLAQILLKGSDAEVQEKVKTIRKAFKSGISFEELAKQHSADSSAKRTGGKLGIFKPGDLLAEIGEVTNNLEPGQISKVVQTNLGNHLLYIYEEVFAEGLDCDNLNPEQETHYSNALYAQKRDALLVTYMDELFACANIEVKDPGNSDLPTAKFLPVVEKKNINCQARRIMVLPQKKKKGKKRQNK